MISIQCNAHMYIDFLYISDTCVHVHEKMHHLYIICTCHFNLAFNIVNTV